MSEELIEKIARATYATSPLLDPEGFAKGYKRPRPLSWDEAGVDERLHQLECARAALAAIEASGTHVVVPLELTPMMESLADTAIGNDRSSEVVWAAALSARPKVTK